jgi:small subunit ribosomal protein S25
MPKPIPGPSHLSRILQNLNKAPRPTLVGVKEITLTLAQRNDHFGARQVISYWCKSVQLTDVSRSHFMKEDLPRIRYANPNIGIRVNKLPKTSDEAWKPELVLEFCASHSRLHCA